MIRKYLRLAALMPVATVIGCCTTSHAPWEPLEGSISKASVADRARSDDDNDFVIDRHAIEFDPIDTSDATAIVIVVDTADLWWWPESCGPTYGWEYCPDYISLFETTQHVWGFKKYGQRFRTGFRDDLQFDYGELFLFEKAVNAEEFDRAREALEQGRIEFAIHTHTADYPYRVQIFGGAIRAHNDSD